MYKTVIYNIHDPNSIPSEETFSFIHENGATYFENNRTHERYEVRSMRQAVTPEVKLTESDYIIPIRR